MDKAVLVHRRRQSGQPAGAGDLCVLRHHVERPGQESVVRVDPAAKWRATAAETLENRIVHALVRLGNHGDARIAGSVGFGDLAAAIARAAIHDDVFPGAERLAHRLDRLVEIALPIVDGRHDADQGLSLHPVRQVSFIRIPDQLALDLQPAPTPGVRSVASHLCALQSSRRSKVRHVLHSLKLRSDQTNPWLV